MLLELLLGVRIELFEVFMEMCFEVFNYDYNWFFDILVWINGVEIGMWICFGDFGDRRGNFNLVWWYEWFI